MFRSRQYVSLPLPLLMWMWMWIGMRMLFLPAWNNCEAFASASNPLSHRTSSTEEPCTLLGEVLTSTDRRQLLKSGAPLTIRGGESSTRLSSFRNSRKTAPQTKAISVAKNKNNKPSAFTRFWSLGVWQVHSNYLKLIWALGQTTARLVLPVVLAAVALSTLGCLSPETFAASCMSLESVLLHFQHWTRRATLLPLAAVSQFWINPAPLGSFSLAFSTTADYNAIWTETLGMRKGIITLLIRPLIDTLVFRMAVKAIWDVLRVVVERLSFQILLITKRHNTDDIPKTVATIDPHGWRLSKDGWMLWSSLLFACVHMGTSLPSPSFLEVQSQITQALQTGEVTFLGLTMYRDYFSSRLLEGLLTCQPLMIAWLRMVWYGLLSWTVLCPLYAMHGGWASSGAQCAWWILGAATGHTMDTQLLVRGLYSLLIPWNTSKKRKDDLAAPSYFVDESSSSSSSG